VDLYSAILSALQLQCNQVCIRVSGSSCNRIWPIWSVACQCLPHQLLPLYQHLHFSTPTHIGLFK